MSIDALTVAAQAFNFLVLVWLLKRFLFGPITRAMEARERDIRGRLDDAARARRQAEAEAERLEAERRDFAAAREALMADAHAEADVLRRSLEATLRREMDERRERWRRQIDEERDAFLADLRLRTATHVLEVARVALGTLANTTLEDAIAEAFADRLSGLQPDQRDALRDAAREPRNPVVVETSFPLAPAIEARISGLVREVLAPRRDIDFGISDNLVCGIRLRVGGRTVSWTLAAYLDRLEAQVREALGEGAAEMQGGSGL